MPRSRSASTTWNGHGLWCEHRREPGTTRFLGCIRLPFSQPITKARFLNKERAARFLRTRTARRCPRDLGGQRMQGAIEALLSGLVLRGLGPILSGILMAAPLRKVARAQLKKIYVLDERGEMAGEYILDQDCPIDYNDFLKVLPDEGIGDRDSLFVGEYVFTAFQSGKFVFVLLSRGQLAPEDVNWTALLLTAADTHLASAANRPAPPRAAEPKPDVDKGIAERDARLQAKEKSLAELEAKLKADAANLSGRQEELDRQKARLAASRTIPPNCRTRCRRAPPDRRRPWRSQNSSQRAPMKNRGRPSRRLVRTRDKHSSRSGKRSSPRKPTWRLGTKRLPFESPNLRRTRRTRLPLSKRNGRRRPRGRRKKRRPAAKSRAEWPT